MNNNFLQFPPELQDAEDPDFIDTNPLRSQFEPFQQKVFYEPVEDSSEADGEESSSTDEDVLLANEQPYKTSANIGFSHLTKQVPIKEFTKRSDIMITSTLSMSLYPKDNREIENHF